MTAQWPEAPTAGEALDRIRKECSSESEKGRWFENLFLRLIRDNPEFEVKNAWRWADCPGEKKHRHSGKDLGIDLVAERKDGKLIAIQCKCYDEKDSIQKKDIDSFLSDSTEYDFRWIVATCGWGKNAEDAILNKRPPVSRIDFHEYGGKRITKGRFEMETREPLDLQKDAIRHVTTGFTSHDRGQMIMACGTGKTFTSLRIAEQMLPRGGYLIPGPEHCPCIPGQTRMADVCGQAD